MTKLKALVLIAAIQFLPGSLHAADQAARKLLGQALAAQGGEAKLRQTENVQWEASGYRNMLEQSERPEGPYITEFLTISEIHDFEHHRYRSATESAVYPAFKSSSAILISNGAVVRSVDGHAGPGPRAMIRVAEERMALSPEHLLLTALDAPDTRREADVRLQSIPQNVITFSLDGAPVRIYLNPYTHLPTAMDYSGPLARTGYWAFLGCDVTMRTYYSFWWLAKGGIHLPMQWNVESNGLPDSMVVIRKLEINSSLKEADLTIPKEIRTQFQQTSAPADLDHLPLGLPNEPAKEIAPGIVLIPGRWNVTLIDQGDGVVILEAPISSGYSAKVIAEAERRFPGKPIKAVVTTSDSWPHLAGIREYVADGVPIYALDQNRPILDRVIAAHHSNNPDALERVPRQPSFRLVHRKTELGSGVNRIEIYPIRGETSERQMMVYFPEHRLLYGSDPFQKLEDGSYSFPQTVSELVDAASREDLNVTTLFMMHIGPTPWAELPKIIAGAAEHDSPSGSLQ